MIKYLKARYFAANYFTGLRLSDKDGNTAAGKTKKKKQGKPLRLGQPWNWMPPLAPMRRNKRRRQEEILFLGQ